jgi:hypothetical protein
MSNEPAAQAHLLLERLFALLRDCRALVPQLEGGRRRPGAGQRPGRAAPLLRAGRCARGGALVRTAEDALTVLRQGNRRR